MRDASALPDLAGFTGFVPFADLPTSDVPIAPGVYAIVRSSTAEPQFLDASPAGRFKGKHPSLPTEVLAAKWVPAASVVYIGKAAGARPAVVGSGSGSTSTAGTARGSRSDTGAAA